MNQQSSSLHKKKIYLIGAGPGDPELITLKAVRALAESRVVLYDHLINVELLSHCSPEAERIFVGKSKDHHPIPQEQINAIIEEKAAVHDVIARLKGGDPFIFGRGGEEMEYLIARGYCCEVIPGITAACAGAAEIGLPLTHRDHASELVFMTGHKRADDNYERFRNLDLQHRTHVIYMGVTALEQIMHEICKKTENRDVGVAVIENAGSPRRRVFRGTAATIAELARREQVRPPALIVIGRVVSLLK